MLLRHLGYFVPRFSKVEPFWCGRIHCIEPILIGMRKLARFRM